MIQFVLFQLMALIKLTQKKRKEKRTHKQDPLELYNKITIRYANSNKYTSISKKEKRICISTTKMLAQLYSNKA